MQTINDDMTVVGNFTVKGAINAPNAEHKLKSGLDLLAERVDELAAQVATLQTQLAELRSEHERVAEQLNKKIIL